MIEIVDIDIFVGKHHRSDLSTKKTIYIVRHGQTDYNKQGIIQGSGIDSDLNETGIRQAHKFHQTYGHIPFDAVYTSQLRRTQQSMLPFASAGHQLIARPEFNEINWGIYEGVKSTPEHKEKYSAIVNRWKAGFLDEPIEGGESPNALFTRQKRGLEHLLMRPSDELILLCMHGRAMRSFLCLLLNEPLSEMDQWEHTNFSLYVVEMTGYDGSLKVRNEISHTIV